MTTSTQLLPAFCKPYEDELLSSWLARMAFNHGLSTRDFCKLVLENHLNPDIDVRISAKNLSLIAAQTGCTLEQVKNTTMLCYENNLFSCLHNHSFDNWAIGSSEKTNLGNYSSGLMYCPKCLGKKPYFKKQWRLAISFVCTDCRCYLVDRCPHCKGGNSFMSGQEKYYVGTIRELMLNCHQCGKDVTKCEVKAADDLIVETQQKLYDIVNEGIYNQIIYIESYFSVLHHLAKILIGGEGTEARLKGFIKEVYDIGGYDLVMSGKWADKLVRRLSAQERAVVTTLAYWLLEEWPYRFIGLCNKHYLNSKTILHGFWNAPYWFKEPIREGLIQNQITSGCNDTYDKTTSQHIIEVQKQKTLDYDYDLSDFYYDDEKYADIELEEYVI